MLARLGFEDFYGLFGADNDMLNAAIGKQFDAMTELGSGLAAIEGDRVDGIACAYPREEMAARQTAAMKLLLEVPADRPHLFRMLRAFGALFPAPAPGGMYVARVGVAPDRRKRGIAARLLQGLERIAVDEGHPHVQIHVRRDNAGARAFYSLHGYGEQGSGGNIDPRSYVLLRKVL